MLAPDLMENPFQHRETDKKETRHRKKSRVPAVASAVKGRWLEMQLLWTKWPGKVSRRGDISGTFSKPTQGSHKAEGRTSFSWLP